jgi:hypothetical protein
MLRRRKCAAISRDIEISATRPRAKLFIRAKKALVRIDAISPLSEETSVAARIWGISPKRISDWMLAVNSVRRVIVT